MALFNITLNILAIPPWLKPAVTDIGDRLANLEKITMSENTQLAAITASVTHNTDVVESALTLIANIKAELDAAGTDPVALAALSATLDAEDAKLAAAVVANTPAASAPQDGAAT